MKAFITVAIFHPAHRNILLRVQDFLNYNNLPTAINHKKLKIKVITVEKKFTPKQIDAMRRAVSVLNAHNMSAKLVIKMKVEKVSPLIKRAV